LILNEVYDQLASTYISHLQQLAFTSNGKQLTIWRKSAYAEFSQWSFASWQ